MGFISYNKQQQKQYRKHRPKSAISEYYQFYLFLLTLTDDELRVLFTRRKQDCKYCKTTDELTKLRTEMAIINDVLNETEDTG